MRAVAIQMIFFIYLFSTCVWLVDEMILQHASIRPMGIGPPGDSTVIDTDVLVAGEGDSAQNYAALSDRALNIGQEGNVLDRITDFAVSGYNAIWVSLELLSGSYAWYVLDTINVPTPFIQVLQWIFPFIVISQVVWYVAGRY